VLNQNGNLKQQSDKVYHEFRTVCDNFFEEKAKFYEVIKEQSAGVRVKKLDIIQKIEALQKSQDWKNTTQAIIKLQEDWKSSGTLPRNEEQRLFGRLRAASNFFFDEKRKHYEVQDAQYVGNLKLKEDLITEISSFQLSSDSAGNRNTLKDFSQRFQAIGMVPMKDKERINNAFYKHLDEHYNKLNINASEKAQMQYADRLDQLAAMQGSDNNLRKELDFLRKQQQDLEKNIQTFERNLGFFNVSKGKNPLVLEMENKIQVERNKIDAIIKKQKQVKTYLDQMNQPKTAPAELENQGNKE
jgi:K+/H+ antiporter YhaU regulatory subunit KhtT